uniref:CCHC-type domain-containing protein n=1 Tax=Nicotiana tabacum TaxID=4097 RepID=A0A1S4C834_TOBAC|nr:PREDICTED: uncharacterized protein LOC107816123 [Nicotiana tabacum]
MVRRNGGILKRGNSSKPKNYDLCHKCGKPGHFIKDCPLLKQEHSKYNPKKAAKRNSVPDKDFKRKGSADNVVKQALAAWGDSSSEFEDETDVGDSSMMAVETSVFIDSYHSHVEDKDALTLELGEAEQTRDDLVMCVVDLKETICELKKENFVLTEKIANIEHERDDLVVVVVDHKETIENFKKEREALMKRVTEIEEERDDLLVVIANLRKTIEGLGTESKPGNSKKEKRYKNIYVVDFESIQSGDLSCLKAVDDAELWHRKLGHASFSLLNKLIQKDLVHGLPMSKFKVQKVCDACARGKHVKSSFKSKKDDHVLSPGVQGSKTQWLFQQLKQNM